MKKSILFMNTDLGVGGVTASMINTANELSNYYEVSIFCYNPEGDMKERLSPKVHLLDSSWRLVAMCSKLDIAKKRGMKYFLYKVFARVWSKIFNNKLPVYIAIKHQKNLGKFDLACSFTHEGDKHIEYTGLIRILINKVDSVRKLSWVHCDYNNIVEKQFNLQYLSKVDGIVGVSDSVANVFHVNNPSLLTKIYSCPNMIDYDNLYEKANLPQDFEYKKEGLICFTACRLSKIKGIPRALKSFSRALRENNIFWYIAGDGPLKESINTYILDNNLQDNVFLIGQQNNPFNYMKNSDLYLSVSFEEAAPLVYLEAKALHVPIFSTRTLSTDEMLNKDIDYICPNDEKSLCEYFYLITKNHEAIKNRKQTLANYIGNNNVAISKYNEWLGVNKFV